MARVRPSWSYAPAPSLIQTAGLWRGDEYDFGGAVALLGACLRGLSRNAIEGDWESLPGRLGADERETLEKVLAWAKMEGRD